jgi:hypothetical protein
MAITIIEIMMLLCILIVPLRGPRIRKKLSKPNHIKREGLSDYLINEEGGLELGKKDNDNRL